MSRYRRSMAMLVCFLALIGWIGCGSSSAPGAPATSTPTATTGAQASVDLARLEPVEGWTPGEIAHYTAENLFAYMNGEATLLYLSF